MIELVVRQFQSQFKDAKFIFVVDSDDVTFFSIDNTLRFLAGQNSIVVVKTSDTSGSLCSSLLAVIILILIRHS